MLHRLTTALTASLVFWGAAHGAEVAHPRCEAMDKLKAEFDTKTHAVELDPGQFHFIEGVYVGSPATPDGLPPGDGALLVTHDGDGGGIIVWTRGKLACAPSPVSERLIKLMARVKTGAGEEDGTL
jgi:hypothetical protein